VAGNITGEAAGTVGEAVAEAGFGALAIGAAETARSTLTRAGAGNAWRPSGLLHAALFIALIAAGDIAVGVKLRPILVIHTTSLGQQRDSAEQRHRERDQSLDRTHRAHRQSSILGLENL
jgi:hypothetical protein